MHILHQGTTCSFEALLDDDGKKINIISKENVEKPIVIRLDDEDDAIDLFIPSVEGVVILCFCRSGKEVFFKTKTGEMLSQKDFLNMQQTFYM